MQIKNRILTILTVTVLIVSVIALCYYFFYGRNVNPKIVRNEEQLTKLIKANDSINVLKQRLYLAENRKDLVPPTETVIQEALREAKISPNDIILWKSIYAGKVRSIEMKDSFNGKIENILNLQKSVLSTSAEAEKILLKEKYDSQLIDLLKLRIKYSENSKYRKLEFDYGLNSKVNITKDSLISEPFVVFGQKDKFLGLGKSEYSVVIGDKNPNITQSEAYSATYKPKRKVELGMGPVILANKNSINLGLAVSLKKGIFALTAGYSLYNKNFK